MEIYSLEPCEKIVVDFDKYCLVCIWIIMADNHAIRNFHYLRQQFLTDKYLREEAVQKIKERDGNIESIVSIDLIREKKFLIS